jgi:hypothetical protein
MVALLAALALLPPIQAATGLEYRWFYVMQNLQVEANVSKVEALLRRAKAAGYNGMVLADYKLSVLNQVPDYYFKNVAKVQATAKELGIEIIPAMFSVGYAGGLLSRDPNLAEGMPVRDLEMVVKNGVIELAPEEIPSAQNLSFEQAQGDKMAGWSFQDGIGQSTFADRTMVHGGSQSLRMENIAKANPDYGNCRVQQLIQVRPWRQYHVSVWIKTESFDRAGNARIAILTEAGKSVSFSELGIKPAQDWSQHHLVFNSQENKQLRLYFGVWGGRNGKMWWDDAKIEIVPFLNVLRRGGCPLTVKTSLPTEASDFRTVDNGVGEPQPNSARSLHVLRNLSPQPLSPPGQERAARSWNLHPPAPPPYRSLRSRQGEGGLLREAIDFEPIKDPKLGTVPWPGGFEVYHEAPKLRLTAARKDLEGKRLKVSYYHLATTLEDQVAICLSEPKTYALLQDEFNGVNKLLSPTSFFMSHDEMRVGNWCEACMKRGLTPGQQLADNARKCVNIIRKGSPKANVFVWSDMFDPNHNAHGDYYLVNGSWEGSWNGLDRDVVIVDWYFDARKKTLPFFAGRGHKQILAGYYDGPVENIKTWLKDAADVKGVCGVMYTTWVNDYSNLEAFAKAAWGG